MTQEALPIDISAMSEVARLAHEVARTGRPHVLREHGADIAVLSPARPARRRKAPSTADIAASLSAAGSWKGLVDAEQLKRDLDASRGSNPSAIEL